jgi:hypothetical protein
MENEFVIVATDRSTKKREVVKTGLTKEAAKYQAGHMPTSYKRAYKYFKAAKAKNK